MPPFQQLQGKAAMAQQRPAGLDPSQLKMALQLPLGSVGLQAHCTPGGGDAGAGDTAGTALGSRQPARLEKVLASLDKPQLRSGADENQLCPACKRACHQGGCSSAV